MNRVKWTYERIFHGCSRKQRHYTISDAEAHVASLNKKQGNQGLHVYKCDYCGNYHVGHDRFWRDKRQ